ncbi:21330_t:CDS:2, partial [Gigaspora rosea]
MYAGLIISFSLFIIFCWLTLRSRSNNYSYNLLEKLPSFVNNTFPWIGKKITQLYPPEYIALNEWSGFLISKVIYELTKLEIADIIKAQDGKMNISEIAKVTGADEDKLSNYMKSRWYIGISQVFVIVSEICFLFSIDRLLRVAASKGFFRVLDNGVYANNSQSLLLSKDHPHTFRNFFLLYEEIEISSSAKYLAYDLKLQTDNKKEQMTSFAKAHNGLELFEWLSLPDNKERLEIFNKAMVDQDNATDKGLYQDYDWSQYCNAKFVDVAGGVGGFLSQLMTHYPTMKGVLYELPKVIEMSEQ